jgi:uncharacterized protein (TIGR02246 family)
MRRTYFLTSIVVAFAITGCAPKADDSAMAAPAAAAPDTAAIRSTIEATEKQWSAAYLKGDGAAIAALYTEDAASVPASGDWARGRDGIAKDEQAQFDSVTIATREDVPEEVTVAGDFALEVGHYSWTGKSKKTGAARGETGRYMVLWRKDTDGTWRLYRDMGTTATPAKKM